MSGWKEECVGDDIAWMSFDSEGELQVINPDNALFRMTPDTSATTNPNAMVTIQSNVLFTNVAETSDGSVYWEGIDQLLPLSVTITSWLRKPWKQGQRTLCSSEFLVLCPGLPVTHHGPNLGSSRRCSYWCHHLWRLQMQALGDVTLMYQALNWNHGMFVGSSMSSKSTVAAANKRKIIMHEQFAMRPFLAITLDTTWNMG